MILAKQHKNQNSLIVSVCDSDLIGKKFEEDDFQLDLTSNFYKGEKISEQNLLNLAKKTNIMMFVGTKSVDFALKNNLGKKEQIKKV